MITTITEAEILELPTYICVGITRMTYENAKAFWALVEEQQWTVYIYDPILTRRHETAKQYQSVYRLSPFSLLTSDYIVFVDSWALIQCRLMGDYTFEVLRSDRTYNIG